MYAVVCRSCQVRVLVAARLDDPQIAVMLSHLRIRHPDALPQPKLPEFTAVIRHFQLRDGRRRDVGRSTRRPDARRRRALARAAGQWGGVTVLVRGRLAAQWVAAILVPPGTARHEPPGVDGGVPPM